MIRRRTLWPRLQTRSATTFTVFGEASFPLYQPYSLVWSLCGLDSVASLFGFGLELFAEVQSTRRKQFDVETGRKSAESHCFKSPVLPQPTRNEIRAMSSRPKLCCRRSRISLRR